MASRGDWKRKLYGRLHQDLSGLTIEQVVESLGGDANNMTPTERGRVSSVVEQVTADLERKSVRQKRSEESTSG